MTISEKSAYLKGLMDGLKLNTESDEGKMISAIVDLLGDMAKRVTDIEETTIAISDELDEIEEDLDAIEDFIMDEEYEDEDEDDSWDAGMRTRKKVSTLAMRILPFMRWNVPAARLSTSTKRPWKPAPSSALTAGRFWNSLLRMRKKSNRFIKTAVGFHGSFFKTRRNYEYFKKDI